MKASKWRKYIRISALILVLVLIPLPVRTNKNVSGWAIDENGSVYSEVELQFKNFQYYHLLSRKSVGRMKIEFPEDGFQPLTDISVYGEDHSLKGFWHIQYFSAFDTETRKFTTGYIAAILDNWGRSVFVLIACPDSENYKYIVAGPQIMSGTQLMYGNLKDLCSSFGPFLPDNIITTIFGEEVKQ